MLTKINSKVLSPKVGEIYYFFTEYYPNDFSCGFHVIKSIDEKEQCIRGDYYFVTESFVTDFKEIDFGTFLEKYYIWLEVKDRETAYLAEPEDLALFLLIKAPIHEISRD